MSSTVDFSVLPQIPPQVEDLRDLVTTKFPSIIEDIKEVARQSGSAQFAADAKAAEDVAEKLKDMVVRALGEESDTVGGEGTVMAAYNAGKKLEAATGGEI